MKNSNSNPATDTTRIDDLILSLETRLAEVKKFRENKVGKLEEFKPRIIAVLKKCGVTVTGFGNLYSTGNGDSGEHRAHREDCQMMVTVTAIPLNTPYKQVDRITNKIEKAFDKEFGNAIGVDSYVGGALSITSKGVERTVSTFHIRVR